MSASNDGNILSNMESESILILSEIPLLWRFRVAVFAIASSKNTATSHARFQRDFTRRN